MAKMCFIYNIKSTTKLSITITTNCNNTERRTTGINSDTQNSTTYLISLKIGF